MDAEPTSSFICLGCSKPLLNERAIILSQTLQLQQQSDRSYLWMIPPPPTVADINDGPGWMCHATPECMARMLVSRFDVDPLMIVSAMAAVKK
jgi:hypothetical protein